MKKLICVILSLFLLLQSAMAVSALEAENDYSDVFFEYMKEYIEINEHHEGLVKSSYKLLGDTSNGFHIAYCMYYYGDNVDFDRAEYSHIEHGDYAIIGRGECVSNKPSGLGLYCFNSDKCYTLERACEQNIIPLDEVTEIINNSSLTVYAYNKTAEKQEIIEGFVNFHYGPSPYPDNSTRSCEILGEYDNYTLFLKGDRSLSEYKVIGDYFIEYERNTYVFDGLEIYSLLYALQVEMFKLTDVAKIIDAKPLGDATLDGKLNMSDVVWLQRLVAHLESLNNSLHHKTICDANKDDRIDMEDVVLIQRIIAKI